MRGLNRDRKKEVVSMEVAMRQLRLQKTNLHIENLDIRQASQGSSVSKMQREMEDMKRQLEEKESLI
jgi:hypothetical protein